MGLLLSAEIKPGLGPSLRWFETRNSGRVGREGRADLVEHQQQCLPSVRVDADVWASERK